MDDLTYEIEVYAEDGIKTYHATSEQYDTYMENIKTMPKAEALDILLREVQDANTDD